MKESLRTYWRGEIKSRQELMRHRAKTWRRLMEEYDLQYNGKIVGLPDKDIVRLSRFYPLARQILATLSFNYPRIFIRVEQEDQEQAGDILERFGNMALRMMNTKREVQQALFDSLFCTVGWLKNVYNPLGDEAVPPYTANDALEEDFPGVMRVAPENILLDPLCPPHNLGMARDIIEEMWVPYEYVKNDERYAHRKDIKPYRPSSRNDGILSSMAAKEQEGEEGEALRKAMEAGEMCLLHEIHDRLHQRRITFAQGVEEPIEDIPHPFRRVLPTLLMDAQGQPILDPMTGEEIPTGEYETQPGYIVENGFPYIPLKLDSHGNSFYPRPPMEYVEDLQNIIIESQSRRRDILKRFRRVGLVNQAEETHNPQIKTVVSKAADGELVSVLDKENFKELTWGTVPSDQVNMEGDAREYEEQTLHVSELQRGGSGPGTATEASIMASAGAINREWMQDKVGEVYKIITRNTLQICGDPRYTPNNVLLNVAPEGEAAVSRALTQADFMFECVIEVEAGSMQPLIEELDKAQAQELYAQLKGDPDIDQIELKKMLLNSARIKDVDKMFSDQVKQEACRAAQLENQFIMLRGQDPGVLPGQDHRTHQQYHDPAQFQQDPAFATLMPQQQQMAMQVLQQHMAAHQQAEAQKMQPMGPSPRSRTSGQPRGIIGRVQSNAQKTADTVAVEGKESGR